MRVKVPMLLDSEDHFCIYFFFFYNFLETFKLLNYKNIVHALNKYSAFLYFIRKNQQRLPKTKESTTTILFDAYYYKSNNKILYQNRNAK